MEGVILSTWDHIMGPQIEKLWLVDDKKKANKVSEIPIKDLRDFNVSKRLTNVESSSSLMETYAAMCGQLLLGEVDSCRTVGEWPSRVYVSESKILIAIMFHLNVWKCPCSNKSLKDVCLCFGTLFKYHTYNVVLHYHHSIDYQLRKVVSAFMNSEFSVASCSKIVIALVEDVTELMTSVKNLYLNCKLIDLLPPLQFFINFDFSPHLSCCIESHLQTSGNTIVIGDENLLINEDIDKSSKFLLKRKNKELGPLTVIDLNMKKVWQSNFEINFKTGKREDLLYLVTETGYLVPELLSDVLFIEKNKGDYRRHIENFKLGLLTKSCALIKSLDHSRNSGKLLSKKELMIMFSMQNLVDLEILLGCTEYIKPGIRSIVVA